MTLDLDYADRH